jgi:hypothetical protein
MRADPLGGGLLRFLFETLPRTRRLPLLPTEQAGECQTLQIIERGRDVVVLVVVDLRTRFLRRSP